MSGQPEQSGNKRDDTRESGWAQDRDGVAQLSRRHLRFGWRSLLIFLSLGITLEVLHGLKVGWYLDIAHTTRRHMWTLAHAHGTLLAVLNLVLGATLQQCPSWKPRRRKLASACLLSAGVVLPVGFLLGGVQTYEGDPGLGIVLVPVGGLLLFVAVLLVAAGKSA